MGSQSTATKQSDWYVEVEGLDGTWAVAGAPTKSGTSQKVADGGAPEETLIGDPTWNDIDLSRPWRRGRDKATYRRIDQMYGDDVIATWFCKGPDGVIAETLTYLCTVGGMTGPSADRMSTTPATLGFSLGVNKFVG